MKNKLAEDKFLLKVRNNLGDLIEVIGDYTSSLNRIDVRCNICGYKWSPLAGELSRNRMKNDNRKACPNCRNKNLFNKSEQSLLEFIEINYKNKYKLVGKYKGSHKKVLFNCIKHGDFLQTPSSFKAHHTCPKCSVCKKRDKEEFKEEFLYKFGDDFEIVGDYINMTTKIKVRHKSDNCSNFIWEQRPSILLRTKGTCPKCSGKYYTEDDFNEKVSELTNGEYLILGEYVSSQKKLLMKHNIDSCGNEYYVRPNNFINSARCPKCTSSKAEQLISNLLAKLKIPYQDEFKFEDCRDKGLLRFDFEISGVLIEYDGEQHFEKTRRRNSERQFLNVKRRDKIKNQYCIDNNIPLIRIPYRQQKNIECILHNVIIHFGLIENKQDIYDEDIVLKYLVDENWNHEKYIEENKQRDDADGK